MVFKMRYFVFALVFITLFFQYSFASRIFLDEIQYYDFGESNLYKVRKMDNPFAVNPRPYDVIEYDLYLDWYNVMKNPTSMDSLDRIWFGVNTITAKSSVDNLTNLELDCAGLYIDSVFVSNGSEFQKVVPTPKVINKKLIIPLQTNLNNGDTVKIKVFYTYARNIPEENYRGFYLYPKGKFVGRLPAPFYDSVFVEERLAYTMSEPEDARYWMPCNDAPYDKANARITVRVPKDYVVASNGYLDKVLTDGDTAKIFFWISDKPITTYLMSVTTSKYVIFSDWYRKVTNPNDSIEIQYYVWEKDFKATKTDGSEYNAKNTFQYTSKMMEFFSKTFLEYPFIKYGMTSVMPFNFGGMEHQTITTINRVWLRQNSQFGIAHELAHQWIGDLVTCATWNDIWFNEGGATWSEALYAESLWGDWGYNYFLLSSRQSYLKKGGLTLPPIYGLPTNTIFGDYAVLVYQKASWVYHMLKFMLGDSLFFQTFRSFLQDFSFQSITTEDIINYFSEKVTNPLVDFSTFFNQWLFKAGHPVFVVNSAFHSFPNQDNRYEGVVTISQTQSGNNIPEVFKCPVRILFKSGDTLTTSSTLVVEERTQSFKVSLPFFPDSIFIDTTSVLCEVGDIYLTSLESNQNEEIKIFPNPVEKNQILFVEFSEKYELPIILEIFDILGNKLLTKKLDLSSGRIVSFDDVGNLPSGMYVLRVHSPKQIHNHLIQKN
ncbi:MAG: hypothetical protein CH6_2737 [Candidatus Kapaibacterium sp.]|nr:MAG: hypothetical protein CH6_2737 [Candidatus Kapabacteria bacterium]